MSLTQTEKENSHFKRMKRGNRVGIRGYEEVNEDGDQVWGGGREVTGSENGNHRLGRISGTSCRPGTWEAPGVSGLTLPEISISRGYGG